MNNLILFDKKLVRNPKAMAQLIKDIACDINNNKKDLNEIKNRGWWKRVTNNNTADLADSIIKQNDIISTFYGILQAVLFLSVNNTRMLQAICKRLRVLQGDQDLVNNDLYDKSIEFLERFLCSAKRSEKQLEELTGYMIKKAKIDEQQDIMLKSLEANANEKRELDQEQSRKISELYEKLGDIKYADKGQEKKILSIVELLKEKDATDRKQDEKVEYITKVISNLEVMIRNIDKGGAAQDFTKQIKRNSVQRRMYTFVLLLTLANLFIVAGLFIYIVLRLRP